MIPFVGRRVLVVGMARSGQAAARLLSSLGARPVLSDQKTDVDGVDALMALGCIGRLGDAPETLLDGVAAVIVSPGVPPTNPVFAAAEKLGIPVLSELELGASVAQGTHIAITGTNGKTTTTALTAEMLKNAGRRAFACGNIGRSICEVALVAKPEDVLVIEVSSFQLERVTRFHPQVAALLNLTPDHLNRHGTMEQYGALKAKITQQQTESNVFVYNADDAFATQTAKGTQAKAVPFSRKAKQNNGAWVEDGQIVVSGRALCAVGELSLPGPHNLENALAAAAIASEMGVPAAVIRHTLRSFQGVEHRMERVRTLDNVVYINDSKGTNPESTQRAVEGMTVPTVLLLGGDDKGSDYRNLVRAIVDNPMICHVVTLGKTADELETALRNAGFSAIVSAGFDFASAIRAARALSVSGGAVVLSPACASFDMFKDFEERGRIFKEMVNQL